MNFKKLKIFLATTVLASSSLLVAGGYHHSNAMKFEEDKFGIPQSKLDKPFHCIIVTDATDPDVADFFHQNIAELLLGVTRTNENYHLHLIHSKEAAKEVPLLLANINTEDDVMLLLNLDMCELDTCEEENLIDILELPYSGITTINYEPLTCETIELLQEALSETLLFRAVSETEMKYHLGEPEIKQAILAQLAKIEKPAEVERLIYPKLGGSTLHLVLHGAFVLTKEEEELRKAVPEDQRKRFERHRLHLITPKVGRTVSHNLKQLMTLYPDFLKHPHTRDNRELDTPRL